jgi:hypothetical protein
LSFSLNNSPSGIGGNQQQQHDINKTKASNNRFSNGFGTSSSSPTVKRKRQQQRRLLPVGVISVSSIGDNQHNSMTVRKGDNSVITSSNHGFFF